MLGLKLTLTESITLNSEKRGIVAGLGEVLWDVFPNGARFGGAPANFAGSMAGLGRDSVRAYMVSGVGTDELGQQAIAEFVKRKVGISFVDVVPQQTGQVLVSIDEAGNASYEFAADTAWDCLLWSAEREQLAKSCDVVCFGTLGQRSQVSRDTIQHFVEATPRSCLRVFDVNLRAPFFTDEVILESLAIANVLKLNEDELPVLAELFSLRGGSQQQLQQLSEKFDLQVAALTRGANGSLLVRGNEVSDLPGQEVDVVDTVGAGDAFTAAMVLGLLRGMDLGAIHAQAAQVSAFVCSQNGATPAFPCEILSLFAT